MKGGKQGKGEGKELQIDGKLNQEEQKGQEIMLHESHMETDIPVPDSSSKVTSL